MKTQSRILSLSLRFALILVLVGLPATSALSLGGQRPVYSYPPDPSSDIDWSAGFNGVADIQAAFNNARTVENNQLGTGAQRGRRGAVLRQLPAG
jgi:hypothetical protein